ncbi:MAG: serine hydrolase [Haliea sp.]
MSAENDYAWPACGRVDTWPDGAWPEAGSTGGWNVDKLESARAMFEEGDSAALMVVWRGHVVASWGEVEEPYLIQSVRKPIINMVAGQLVDEGALDLSMTLSDLEIQDYEPPLSELNLSATVADIFRSRSGIYHPAHYEVGAWKRTRAELAQIALQDTGEPSFPPGQVWVYNNWDFNAAGEIVSRTGGAPVEQLIADLVATPLGMEDFEPGHVTFEEDGELTSWMMDNHSAIPAYLVEMSTRDLARLGLVNLSCGKWADRRLMSEEWVKASITGIPVDKGAPREFDWAQGHGSYGFLWFVEANERRGAWLLDHLPPYYFHSGHRGHRLYVMPHLDLVIVHQVATTGGSGILGQIKRSMFGSDEVPDWQIERLVAMIIAAHPDPAARAAAEAGLAEMRDYREEQQ